MINTILVICIGNICRSPMAEGLLKQAFPDKKISSAGIDAMVGYPADPSSVELMQQHGIDISAHRAQSLMSWMVSDADMIVVMDQDQRRYIEQKYPTSKGKVFRLRDFDLAHSTESLDVPDPYKENMDVFRTTYRLIAQGSAALIERITHIH